MVSKVARMQMLFQARISTVGRIAWALVLKPEICFDKIWGKINSFNFNDIVSTQLGKAL